MSDENITIEIFPAGCGDAILITLGDVIILSDGGFPSTYRSSMKNRLLDISAKGGRLSRMIISHIDADHISGAITFLKENGFADDPKIIPVDQIWHNSYRHLQFKDKKKDQLTEEEKKLIELPKISHVDDSDVKKKEVSFQQGSRLGSTILTNKYEWNCDFNCGPVMVEKPKTINLGNDVKITVLSPSNESLSRLADEWFKQLKKKYKDRINQDIFFDDAFEAILECEKKPGRKKGKNVSTNKDYIEQNLAPWNSAQDEDKSYTNASSITFLVEYKGKKLFFLGDISPNLIMTQIEEIAGPAGLPFEVDVLKVAHHGGFSNNSPELLAAIRAKNYLFSTNGRKYKHPHLPVLAWILKLHKDFYKMMIFNYNQRRLRFFNSAQLKKDYNYDIPIIKQNGYIKFTI